MTEKEKRKLIVDIITKRGYKKLPQGSSGTKEPGRFDFDFGDNFVLTARLSGEGNINILLLQIIIHERFFSLRQIRGGRYGLFKLKKINFSFTPDDFVAFKKENIDIDTQIKKIIEKNIDKFLLEYAEERKKAMTHLIKIAKEYPETLKDDFFNNDKNTKFLLNYIESDAAAMQAVFESTKDERFLPDDVKDIFIF